MPCPPPQTGIRQLDFLNLKSQIPVHAMNTRLFLPALLVASIASAQPAAPDAATAQPDNPPAAPAEAKTEMQKWIEATDAQWQTAFKRDVTDAHEAEVNKAKLQYLAALEDGIKKASSAGDLKGAVALRDEQKRFGDTQFFPEKDEDADAASVKVIRATIRAQLAKVEQNNAARAKALHAKYDQFLAQSLAQLTKAQRLDDALLVQKKRNEVAAAWITPEIAAAVQNANPPAPAPAQTAFPPKVTAKQPSALAKDLAKSDIIKALVGSWHFHWTETGFDADFRFRADGTFTDAATGKKGTWTIADDKIVMTIPNTAEKTIHLPLDPAGTKVTDMRKNRNVVAVKKAQ
jgi:hypothetical protein